MEMGKYCLCLDSPPVPSANSWPSFSDSLRTPSTASWGCFLFSSTPGPPHPPPRLFLLRLLYSHSIESSQITTAAMEPAFGLLSQGASYSLLRAVKKGEAWNQAVSLPGSISVYFNVGSPQNGRW